MQDILYVFTVPADRYVILKISIREYVWKSLI